MSAVFVWDKADLGISAQIHSETSSFIIPNQIPSLRGAEIKSISSRQNHTLICFHDGSVLHCAHDFQQCGSTSILAKLEHVKSLHAQKVNVIQITAGSSHSAVLTKDHTVYTRGLNNKGQLGHGDVHRKNRGRPKLVTSLADHCVLQISCGNDHTLALTNDGLVFVWGSNSFGQLGLGRSAGSHQNLPEVISCLRGIPVRQVAAGGNHSFILSTSGAVYGWGRNDFGQLGLNNTETCSQPKECPFFREQNVKYICCGENHSACLTKGGYVFTFGAGKHGQLGLSSNDNEITPRQVMALSGSEVSQIACGSGHTLAYVPMSGRLYVFGLGGSEQFGLSSIQNKNSPTTIAHPFVLSSDLHSSYFSMQLDNPELRIKSIHAGGNLSFVIVVAAGQTCNSDDFRKEDPASQILTLSEQKITMLHSLNPTDTLPDKFSDEIGKIFSSASCLNGSFLLPNEESYEINSKKYGVNMDAVRTFFQDLAKTPEIKRLISTKIEKDLIPVLPTLPKYVEVMRLYLILPECHQFDQPEFYSSIICHFAKSFLALVSSIAMGVFSSWWSSNQPTFFERLVIVYKNCVQHLLQMTFSANSAERIKINKDLIICMDMLQNLYQVNEANTIIDDTTFIVADLKDEVNIQEDYFASLFADLQGITIQVPRFSNYLFLFDGETKSIVFESYTEIQKCAHCLNGGLQNCFTPQQHVYTFLLSINRQNLINETLSQLCSASIEDLKKPLVVRFEDEPAVGPGVTKEFFRLFVQEVMDPDVGMFTTDDTSMLRWFNPLTRRDFKMFHKVGILCGLIIYNSEAVDLHFPLALYKKLLKKPVTLDDVKELQPTSGRGLQEVLDFDGDELEDVFISAFDAVVAANGTNELCPGGATRVVDQSNKKEYVDLFVDYLLNTSVKNQFDAFSAGFHSICGGKILDSFRPAELRSFVEGNDDYDFSQLEKNTQYGGDYSRHHPTIIFFWEVFHEMSLANKKKFMLFLIGSDRIPITGMKYVEIAIQPIDDGEKFLPIAVTCNKLLCLPRYGTKEQLESKLLMAIQKTEGFSLK